MQAPCLAVYDQLRASGIDAALAVRAMLDSEIDRVSRLDLRNAQVKSLPQLMAFYDFYLQRAKAIGYHFQAFVPELMSIGVVE